VPDPHVGSLSLPLSAASPISSGKVVGKTGVPALLGRRGPPQLPHKAALDSFR